VRFVQLPHPGPEHEVDQSGVRPWLTSKDKHGRTFLVSKAYYRMNLNEENQLGDVAFWGEWEGRPNSISGLRRLWGGAALALQTESIRDATIP
jgi:hypothetical protein